VVKRNIEALGGVVEVDSAAGAGTRVTVRLPLTLAIIDGMTLASGGVTYVLPLASVVESMQPGQAPLHTVAAQGRVACVRGDYVPVLALADVFPTGAPAAGGPGVLVVVEADGQKVALHVDELLGQQQVVVKSLEAHYRRVPGLSGASIMGDGSVALILDASALARRARH
jgi:two-component system chemotaxis sensor kinase CheA